MIKQNIFYKTSLMKLDDGTLAVVGRLIKDTTLEREQLYEEGVGLIKDSQEIRSSPSAIFVLLVGIHRLIYMKETKNAPSMETFRSTLLSFLRKKHKEYIDELYEKENNRGRKITKIQLSESIPRPSLDLVPLTSKESIETFIRKYDVLKSVEYRFSARNDETDNNPFFEQVQKRKENIGSTSTTIKHSNSKGLTKSKVISEVKEVTAQGNQHVKLSGTDSEGDTLKGNNESFQLKKPIEITSKNYKKIGQKLYNSFVSLVADGLIKVPPIPKSTKEKLLNISKRFM